MLQIWNKCLLSEESNDQHIFLGKWCCFDMWNHLYQSVQVRSLESSNPMYRGCRTCTKIRSAYLLLNQHWEGFWKWKFAQHNYDGPTNSDWRLQTHSDNCTYLRGSIFLEKDFLIDLLLPQIKSWFELCAFPPYLISFTQGERTRE